MERSAADLLRAQVVAVFDGRRWVLDGLTDDEYGWEPVAGAWSVRARSADVRGWGTGPFVCEDAWPQPDPVPITTIAWRVVHLAAWTDIYRSFAFEGGRLGLDDIEVPGDRADGIAWLWRAQDAFRAALDATDDADVFTPRPAHWGDRLPLAHLVTIMLTEHVHHTAEIGALRDLRVGRARAQPPLAVVGPAWWWGGSNDSL